jgi:hypothetical protein
MADHVDDWRQLGLSSIREMDEGQAIKPTIMII